MIPHTGQRQDQGQEMIIHLVEVGEYSHKYILAAFTNRENAQLLAGLVDGHVLDPMSLDDALAFEGTKTKIPPNMTTFWQVVLDRDGNLIERGTYEESLLDGDHYGEQTPIPRAQNYEYHNKPKRPSKTCLVVRMYGTSKEQIIKSANEIRAQILAGAKPPKGDIP